MPHLISYIAPCALVSLAPVDVAVGGLPIIDSIQTTDGMRVLLVGQADATQEGPWVAHAGAWTRPDDFAVGVAFPSITPVAVLSGFQYFSTLWFLQNASDQSQPFTVGTDGIGAPGAIDYQFWYRSDGTSPAGAGKPSMFDSIDAAGNSIYNLDTINPETPPEISVGGTADRLAALEAGLKTLGLFVDPA